MTNSSSFHTRRILTAVTLLTLAWAPQNLAYNKSWDQGHACTNVNTPDGLWGRYDYDGVYHGDHTTKECCELICKICPVYANTGRLQKTFTDLSVPGVGPSLTITRTYESQDWSTSLFGNGWMFSYGRKLIVARNRDGEKVVGIRQDTGEKNFFKELPDGTLESLSAYGVMYRLSKQGDGTYTITERDGSAYVLNADGKLSSAADRNGNALLFTYDAVGCLTRVTNASGNYIDFQLGPNGKIVSVSDNLGRTVSYDYDENGNLVAVVDPMGHTTQYVYDTKNRLTQIIDPLGNTVLAVTYDTHQPPRVAAVTEKGETWTIAYQSDRTVKTDSAGNTWTYFFNDVGIIERMIDPLGNVVQQHHNKVTSTSLDWTEDANGNRTTYTYDGDGRIASATDPLGNSTLYTYFADTGRIETETKALGAVTRYQHDSHGNVISIIKDFGGPLQNETRSTYDARGNRTSVTDPLGHTTTYEYDAVGNLAKMTDPLGNATLYTYDPRGNRLTETDAAGNTTTYAYDAAGQLLSMTDALGNTTIYTYDANGNRITETNANGATTTFVYDAHNRLTQVTDATGAVRVYAYDSRDNMTSETDPNGHTTTYEYDVLDRLLRETDALGGQTTYTYDAAGNLLTVTDPNGVTRSFAYDAGNRKTSESNGAGELTTYGYDANGNLTAATLPNGNVISRTYDRLARLTAISDNLGQIAAYTYDAAGRVLTAADGAGHTVAYSYDTLGRTIQLVDALGNATSYSYDMLGNLTDITDREGNATHHSYDALRRKVSSVDQLGNTTAFSFDPLGNLLSVTDANGHVTAYSYDAGNRLTQETYADGTTRAFTYSAGGNVITRTDQQGRVTGYVYDALNRGTRTDYPGTNDSDYTYDAVGNLLTAVNQHATVSFAYENAYRLTQVVQNGRAVNYSYDVANNTTNVTYPGGRLTHGLHDVRGRLLRIDDASHFAIAQYEYDAANRLVTKAYANGITATYARNANGWITDLTYTDGATLGVGFQYEFDKQGNRVFAEALQDVTASEQYVYDSAYRLIDFRRGTLDAGGNIPAPATQTTYTLDALGNWISRTTDGATENRTHNEMNELVAVDAAAYAYDATGNLIDDGTYTYVYDYENRLIRVQNTSSGATVAQYRYGPLGRRVETLTNGMRTEYVYSTGEAIQEYLDGALHREYVNLGGPGNRAIFVAGTTYYCLNNSLGSVVAITDSAGDVVEEYQYSAYGNPSIFDPGGALIAESTVDNPYMFAAMRRDTETGLYHTQFRKYDSNLGRFSTRDPLRSANLYTYAASNPINLTDPLGLWEKVPGEQDTYMVEDGDTLWDLASDISTGNDWVCIWPKEMRNPTTQYWLTLRKCDKFDVSNLTATTGTDLRLAVSPDLAANHNSVYGTTSAAAASVARRIRSTSHQGKTPIDLFYLAGHGGHGAFAISSLTSLTEATATPTYARAKAKKGPLRCWFTRSAEARFIGCSSDGFAASFAAAALRDGAFAIGTNQTIGHSSTDVYWNYGGVDASGNHIWGNHSPNWQTAPIWGSQHNGGL